MYMVAPKRIFIFILYFLLYIPFVHLSFAADEQVKVKILAVNPSETNTLKTSITYPLPPEIRPEDVVNSAGMELKRDAESGTYYLSKEVELKPKETLTTVVEVRNVWVIPADDITKVREELGQNLKLLQGTKYEKTGKLVYDKAMEQIASIEEGQASKLGMKQMIELYRAHKMLLEKIQNDAMSLDAMRQLQMTEGEEARTAKITINAENPSDEAKKMTVRADLPSEIDASSVLDRLNFQLLYDEDKKRFFLEKEDEFGPKEKRKYEIVVKDVWYIPEEELKYLQKQTDTLSKYFNGTSYEEFVKQSSGFVKQSLDEIRKLQEEVKGTPEVGKRINAFTLNNRKLQMARDKVKTMQDLLLEIPLKKSSVEQIAEAVKKMRRIINILQLGFQPDLATTWWIILGIIGFVAVFATVFYVTWLSKLKQSQFAEKLVIYIQEAKKKIKKKVVQEENVAS